MSITLYYLYLFSFFVVYLIDFVLDKILVLNAGQNKLESKSSDRKAASLFNVKINNSRK